MNIIYTPILEVQIKHDYYGGKVAKGLRWIPGAGVKNNMANEGLLYRMQESILMIYASFQQKSKPEPAEVFKRIDQLAASDLYHIFHLTVNEFSFFQYTELPEYQAGDAFLYFIFRPDRVGSGDNDNEIRVTVADKAGTEDLIPLMYRLNNNLKDQIKEATKLRLEALAGKHTSEIEVKPPVNGVPIAFPEGLYSVKANGKLLAGDSAYYLGYQPSQISTLGSLIIDWSDVANIIKQTQEVPAKGILEFKNREVRYRYIIEDKYSSLEETPEIIVNINGGLSELKFERKESEEKKYVFESNRPVPLLDQPNVEFQLAGETTQSEVADPAIPSASPQLNSRRLISKLPLASPGSLSKDKEGQLIANIFVYI